MSAGRETTKDTLLALLAQNRKLFHVQYHGYLSNHSPMALISLYQMGASTQRLTEWFAFYSNRLEPAIPSTKFITSSNWAEYLGSQKFYNDYRDFFKSELQARNGNVKELVADYLPKLMEGVIASAFHAILTLGYGVEIMDLDNGELVIDGLAFLCYGFKSLGKRKVVTAKTKMYTPSELLAKVHDEHPRTVDYQDTRLNFPTKLDIFCAKELSVLDDFDLLKIDSTLDSNMAMDQIANAMVGLYSCTGDFFVLHGVTSGFALKLALSCVPPEHKPAAVRYFMRALTAVYIVQNQPDLEFVSPRQWTKELSETSWDSVLKSAVSNNDEHVIKYVWTCWRENKEHKNELYLLTAGQKAGVIVKSKKQPWWPWAVASGAIVAGLFKYRAQKV